MLALSDPDYIVPGTKDWKAVHSCRLPGRYACDYCGAWGHHLILSNNGAVKDSTNNEEKRCATCARALGHAALPMPALHCSCYHHAGFVDVTPALDGGVFKGPTSRAIDRSSMDSDAAATAQAEAALACARGGELKANTKSWDCPIRTGCPCAVQYVVRWAGGTSCGRESESKNHSSSSSSDGTCVGSGDVLGSSRDIVDGKNVGGTDDPLDFLLGSGEVIVGVELAVTTLQQPGDRAVFVVRADYAFGSRGDGFKVPPNAPPLEIDVELVFVRAPLPLLPKGPALAQQQRDRKARERAVTDASTAPLQERLAAAATQRELGNACVARGAYGEAKEAYDRGFTSLVVTTDEWDGDSAADEHGPDGRSSSSSGLPARQPMPARDKALVAAEKARLHCNRALVNLKLQRWDPAVWDSSRVLDFDSVWGMYARDAGMIPEETQLPSPGANNTSVEQAEAPNPSCAVGQARSDGEVHDNSAVMLGNLPGHLVSKARIRKACALLELAELELLDRKSRASRDKPQGSQQRDGDEVKAASLHRDAETCLATAATALRHCISSSAARNTSEGTTSASGMALAVEDAMNLLSAVEKLEAKKCTAVGARVAHARAAHDAAWAKVCRDRIIGGLDRANKKGSSSFDDSAYDAIASEGTNGEVGHLPSDPMSDLPELSDSDSD